MKAPTEFVAIIGRKRCDVKTATLIAHDAYWDGSNFERSGCNVFLYRTPNGAYFTVTLTQWQGERDRLEPINTEDAIDLYETLGEQAVPDFAAAFPGVMVEDA